jgi:hypothetical protein
VYSLFYFVAKTGLFYDKINIRGLKEGRVSTLGEWNFFGKILIYLGLGITFLGVILWGLGRLFPFLGKLPGDLFYQKGNVSVYFPLATCILLSILLTIILNVVFRR